MTTQELLQPRIEVTAPYPNCPFKVGDVLRLSDNKNHYYLGSEGRYQKSAFVLACDVEKCTANFKLLQWWEKREISDMPGYVTVKKPNSLWELPVGYVQSPRWLLDEYGRIQCHIGSTVINHIQLYRLVPATEEEYTAYINTLNEAK